MLRGFITSVIFFVPIVAVPIIEAINPEMMVLKTDAGEMVWGESYDYDSTGTVLDHKELYDNYILEITTYELDSLKIPHKKAEYFDPSVMFRSIYFHNENIFASMKFRFRKYHTFS